MGIIDRNNIYERIDAVQRIRCTQQRLISEFEESVYELLHAFDDVKEFSDINGKMYRELKEIKDAFQKFDNITVCQLKTLEILTSPTPEVVEQMNNSKIHF